MCCYVLLFHLLRSVACRSELFVLLLSLTIFVGSFSNVYVAEVSQKL